MHNHLVQFLSTGNKLSPFQTVHDWALSLDKASSTHVNFTDFSEAFDSVPHKCLLLKLEQVGIKGNIHGWISSFLVHHRQGVLLDGSTSGWTEVMSGVYHRALSWDPYCLLSMSTTSPATCPYLLGYLLMTAQSTAKSHPVWTVTPSRRISPGSTDGTRSGTFP